MNTTWLISKLSLDRFLRFRRKVTVFLHDWILGNDTFTPSFKLILEIYRVV